MREKYGLAQTFLKETVLPYDGDECLQWPFYRMPNGYGRIHYNRYPCLVTRVVCELTHGAPPTPQHEAAHSCGKGHEGCCSPRHLRWATSSENKQDQLKHGTDKRGVKSPLAKLTEDAAREIYLQRGRPLKELAEKFGTSVQNVCNIQSGRTWAHVTAQLGCGNRLGEGFFGHHAPRSGRLS